MKSRTSIGLSLAAVLAVALSGCAAGESAVDVVEVPAQDPSLEMLDTPAGDPLWQRDVTTVGEAPAIAGESVISYILEDGRLRLAAFDLSTGEEQWSFPASTGAVSHTYPISLRSFESGDGEPFVMNILDPVAGEPAEDGTYQYLHPLQLIEVSTGESITVPHKYWVSGSVERCLPAVGTCFTGALEGAELTVSLTADGSEAVEPALAAFPELELVRWTDTVDGTIMGVTAEEGAVIGRQRDGVIEWKLPFSTLGVSPKEGEHPSDLLRRLSSSGVYFFNDGGEMVRDTSDAVTAVAYGRAIDLSDTEPKTGQARTVAHDMRSGEKLWEADGEMCIYGTAVLCSGEMTYRKTDNAWTRDPADLRLWGFDPATGEELWSVDAKALDYKDQLDFGAPEQSSLRVLRTGDGTQLLDISDGTVTPLAEGQSFACTEPGHTFQAPQWSNPEREMLTWGGNTVAAACGATGKSTDASDFSQLAVATASAKPFTAPTDWNVFEEQTRVIASPSGLTAYRF